MRILSQTNDIKGYHGTIGTPTNMYDYRGEQLFVGDVVCLVAFGVDGKNTILALNLSAKKTQILRIGQVKIVNMLWGLQAFITTTILRCLMVLK